MAAKDKTRYAISNRRRGAIICGVLIALTALSLADHKYGSPLRKAISLFGDDWGDYRKYHNKSFTVIKVVDGDTIDIDIADGKFPHTRIRLLGVDTPEKQNGTYEEMHFAKEASEFAARKVLGKTITVIIDDVGDVRGKYGRLLAYVKTSDGKILNEMLVAQGFGYADLRFEHSHYARYVEMQDIAIKNHVGLWEEVTSEQVPRWLNRERPDLLKKR